MLYSPTVEIIEESFNVRVVTAVKYIVKSPMPIAPSAKRRASEMSITKRLERENDSGNSLNGGVIIEISVLERKAAQHAGRGGGRRRQHSAMFRIFCKLPISMVKQCIF